MRITRSLTASTARSRRHYERGGNVVGEGRLSGQTTSAIGDRTANQTSIAPTSRSEPCQGRSPSRQHHSNESTTKRQTRRLLQARRGKRKEEKDEDGNESENGETAPTRNSVRSSTRRISATNFFAPMISFATRETKRQRVTAGTIVTPVCQRPQISSLLGRKNPPPPQPQPPPPNHRHGGGSVTSKRGLERGLTLGAALQSFNSRQGQRQQAPSAAKAAAAAAAVPSRHSKGATRMPRRRTSLRLASTATAKGTAIAANITTVPTDDSKSGCRHRYPLRPQQQQHQHDAPVATASHTTRTRPSTTCNNDAALLELATRIVVGGNSSTSAAAPGAVDGGGGGEMEPGLTNRCGRRSLSRSSSSPPPLVVWITGAGLSVASGIRPFRTGANLGGSNHSSSEGGAKGGIWDEVLWTMATREAFRKHPADWYRRFWNVYFSPTTTTPQYASKEDETVTTFIRRHSTGYGESDYSNRGSTVTMATAARASVGQNKREPQPNAGHVALDQLMQRFGNCRHVTQNIDGLSLFGSSSHNGQAARATATIPTSERLVEVHGRAGLFKCCPEEDSSSSDDDSEDESDSTTGSTSTNGNGSPTLNRQRRRLPIELGNRRKFRRKQQQSPSLKRRQRRQQHQCPYQFSKILTASQLVYRSNRHMAKPGQDDANDDDGIESTEIPLCPECRNAAMPLALLFDEPYHSHTFYQFDVVEDWIAQADVIVFCGTSFAPVLVTHVALQHARLHDIPIYNFNVLPMASASISATSTGTAAAAYTLNTTRLNVTDIVGPAEVTLPKLLDHCLQLQRAQQPAT